MRRNGRRQIEDVLWVDPTRFEARATPAIALLRIAAKMSSGVDEELIDAIRAVLALSDPDDVPIAMDDAHKALDAYEAVYHGT